MPSGNANRQENGSSSVAVDIRTHAIGVWDILGRTWDGRYYYTGSRSTLKSALETMRSFQEEEAERYPTNADTFIVRRYRRGERPDYVRYHM